MAKHWNLKDKTTRLALNKLALSPDNGVRCTPSASRTGVENDGRSQRLGGRSLLIVSENLIKTSEMPSRYHWGEVRYIGGETR